MDPEYLSDESEDCKSGVEEFEEISMEKLKYGKLKLQKEDGTFVCPFCPGKKKEYHRYGDLLQHANGVSHGKRGAEAAGNHRALTKYLREDLADACENSNQRVLFLEQETPQRKLSEEKLVWPWMGIIRNISTKTKDGRHVGPGNNEMKSQFANFRPKSVQTFWNFQGHLGMAIIEFNNDMIGYGDAQDFGRCFLQAGRGKRDWENNREFPSWIGKDLYGWIATEQDYHGNNVIGKYLQERGNLKTVAEISEDNSRKQGQLLQSLHTTIWEKNQEIQYSKGYMSDLQNLVLQTNFLLKTAQAERIKMEEKYKQDIRAMEQESQRVLQMQNEEMQEERKRLGNQIRVLQEQCEVLENQEIHNDAQRREHKMEIEQNERELQRCLEQSQLHRDKEAEKIKLIKKHEEECKDLISLVHKQKKKLVNQHKLEMQIHSLETIIATRRLETDESSTNSKDIKNKIIIKLKQELQDLKEDKEVLQDMNNDLVYKERELNDELQEAWKEAIKILKERGNGDTIGIKRMGELDEHPWKEACKNKYKDNLQCWEEHLMTLLSNWESNIRDGSWYPYKMVKVDEETYEKKINDKDERLSKLREGLGEDVYKTVVTALNELEEYNSSGRYPVPVVWNFKENRRATMKEVLQYMCTKNSQKKRRA